MLLLVPSSAPSLRSESNQKKQIGRRAMGEVIGRSSGAIDSSNVGFRLLKKCGWKEGTGLGVSEQGRLEPLQTHAKKNKLGLGAEVIKQRKVPADKMKQNKMRSLEESSCGLQHENLSTQPKKKTKLASKKLRKMAEEEKRWEEKEFERAFFREFWPDNV